MTRHTNLAQISLSQVAEFQDPLKYIASIRDRGEYSSFAHELHFTDIHIIKNTNSLSRQIHSLHLISHRLFD